MPSDVKPPSFLDNPRLKNIENCKSGRPKSVVRKELAEATVRLNELHLLTSDQMKRFLKAEERIDRWKANWKVNNPSEPLDMEDCPHKVVELDMVMIEDHRILHYVIKALQDELEGKEEV